MANPTGKGGRRFLPGQSGNYAGRPPLPPQYRAIKKLSRSYLSAVISKFALMTPQEFEEYVINDNPNMIEAAIASILQKAVANCDQTKLEFLLNRSIGKVHDEQVPITPRVIYKTNFTSDGRTFQEIVQEGAFEGEIDGRFLSRNA